MDKRYGIAIQWSDEDGGYIATCEDFPGVSAFGETYEDAAREMSVALDAAMDTCRVLGRELPAPAAKQPPARSAAQRPAAATL